MYTFAEAVIHNKHLDPHFIAERRMKSVVLPELPSCDEIERMATLLDEGDFDVWANQFGLAEDHMRATNLDAVTNYYEKESYMNVLIRFNEHNLSLWIPDHHEYFVMFGEPASVDRVMGAPIFDYTFQEYLQAPHMSEKSKQILLEIQRKYTID